MGNAGVTPRKSLILINQRLKWVHQTLDDKNDEGSNKIYTQRILADDLYPYSVRPDLRLRDTLRGQHVSNYVHVRMSSKMKTGAQGGVLNVPLSTVSFRLLKWIWICGLKQ